MTVLLNLICLVLGLLVGGFLVSCWSDLSVTREQIKRLDRERALADLEAARERRRYESLETINLNTREAERFHEEDL